MVVPDRHEGPPRTRVLDVRVVEIGAIEGSVVVERRRNVERVCDLLAVLVPDDVAKAAVVAVTVRAGRAANIRAGDLVAPSSTKRV